MRRYAAKAIFELSELYRDGRRRRVFYEVRLLNVSARNEASAANKFFRHCERDQWTHSDSELKLQRQRFLGLADIDDISTLGPTEVWYEYVDDKPRVDGTIRPRRKK